MMWTTELKCILLLVYLSVTTGYKAGAPMSVCENMTPSHGYQAQTSKPPYTITVNTLKYTPGMNILVTLNATSPSDYFFEGFLIMARMADCSYPDVPIGRFTLLENDPEIRLMTCPKGKYTNNAVTHSSSAHKISKSFLWNNPVGGDVYFKYTMVNHKDTFWPNIISGRVEDATISSRDYPGCATGSILVRPVDPGMLTTTKAPPPSKVNYTDTHFPVRGAAKQMLPVLEIYALVVAIAAILM